MNELKVFESEMFGKVKVIIIQGKEWFIAKEIADTLGYKDSTMLYKRLSKNHQLDINPQSLEYQGLRQNDVSLCDNPNTFKMKLLNEAGLYNAIFGSKLESAEKFQNWVFEEVLPSIRKTGGYIPITQEDDEASIMAKALMIAQRTLEKKEELIKQQQETIQVQQETIEEQAPKVEYHDTVLVSKEKLTTTLIAKDYGLSAKTLNKILHDKGVIYKQGNNWFVYSKYEKMGLMETHTWVDPKCEYMSHTYTRWTQVGRKFIHELLTKEGYKYVGKEF